MIVKDEFLNKLKNYFGLNLYEVKIWTALLSRGVSSAGELSDIGNVPRSRAYDILESLEKKGFVVMKLGKPIKYLAVDPNEVLNRVKKNIKREAESESKKLDGLKGSSLLEELELLHRQGIEFVETTDMSGAIRGRQNVYNHLELLIKGAEKSVTLVTTDKGLLRKFDALKGDLVKLSKKGVNIRIAAPINDKTKDAVQELVKFATVKDVGNLKARFCIVDGEHLLFMVMNDADVHPSYDIGIWTNTNFFASGLDELFNLSWENLKDANSMLAQI